MANAGKKETNNGLEVNCYCTTCMEDTSQLWQMVLPEDANDWIYIRICFSCSSKGVE